MNTARLALSWLTVLPVRGPDEVDRTAAGRAIALAPLVGLLLGGGATVVLWGATRAGTDSALAGLLTVAALALATRGMHLDGLADTFDGLGSYGPPERARQIMKSGTVGPFGVAAIVVVTVGQGLSFGALAAEERWFAVALAVAAGRTMVVFACRRGRSAAPGAGFGALVADTQSPVTGLAWLTATLLASVFAVPGSPWQGPLVTATAFAATWLLVRHTAHRFGGLSGDVLGATVELAVLITAVGYGAAR